MTHQYESEILNKLMERDGFNIPSSVPPYEAEIKAYLINQVKQAYPKLTDYEAEWLLYNYTKHLPADFPVSSVSNVTEASFENVVPFAYQSAILKGQTLVNYFPEYTKTMAIGTGNWRTIFNGKINIPLTPNTSYLFINNSNVGKKIHISVIGETTAENNVIANLTTNIAKFTTPNTTDNFSRMKVYLMEDNTSELTYDSFMVIPYQDGMENWNIPYFEGMQSVKMPVLTTTGKNLFDTTIPFDTDYYGSEGSCSPCYYDNEKKLIITEGISGLKNSQFQLLKFKPNTTYTFSGNVVGHQQRFCIHNESKQTEFIGKGYFSLTVATGNSGRLYASVLKVGTPNGVYGIENLQIEESSSATTYEPYKSNILTVNEDIELRGIGEVKDELNLLTGELTQRITKFNFLATDDGNWNYHKNENGYTSYYMSNKALTSKNNGICDKLPICTWAGDAENMNKECVWFNGATTWGVMIKSDKATTKQEFLNYLNDNIELLLISKTESIKTVDLKTVNESGESVHFMPLEGTMNVSCSSETIQPTFDMSVPVEATTQNLASFIDLEMEE